MKPEQIRHQLEDDVRNHRATALTAAAALVVELLDAQLDYDVGPILVDEPAEVTQARGSRLEAAEAAIRIAFALPSRAEIAAEDEAQAREVVVELEAMGIDRDLMERALNGDGDDTNGGES